MNQDIEPIEPDEADNNKANGARGFSCVIMVVIIASAVLLAVGYCSRLNLQQDEIDRTSKDRLEENYLN